MGRLLMITSLPCVDTATRDKLLNKMTEISQGVLAEEPGVFKYALFVPNDDDAGRLMYSIEEYADQAAFDSHLATQPVKEMFDWVFSADIFERPPITDILDSREDSEFIRADILRCPNLCVGVRELNGDEETFPQLVRVSNGVISTAEDEKEILLFGVYPDVKDSKRVFTLEACASAEVLEERQRYLGDGNDSRQMKESATECVILEMKGGFLYR